MTLRTRLMLVIGVATLLPIGVLGWGANVTAKGQIEHQVTTLQAHSVDGMALFVRTWVEHQVRGLKLQLKSFDLDRIAGSPDSAPKLQGFLRLVQQNAPEVRHLRLVDGGGQVLASLGDAPLTQNMSPLIEQALKAGRDVAVGPPILRDGVPWIPVVLKTSGSLTLEVELSLEPVAEEFQLAATAGRDLALIDEEGRVLIPGELGLVDGAVFRVFLEDVVGGGGCDNVRYQVEDEPILAACAFVGTPGWLVVLAEPVAQSLGAAQQQIGRRTAFFAAFAALMAVVFGTLFARNLASPVVRLKSAALAVADGELGLQVKPEGRDEVADLAEAFNYMSGRLKENRMLIDQKNEEIEGFNRELQDRVAERTRELEEATARLVQSARLAAVGELGAGLAHELNNPLAGLLGVVQVLRARGPDDPMLANAEDQARRCSEIVADLLRISQPRDGSVDEAFALSELLDEIVRLVQAPFRQRQLSLSVEVKGVHQIHGDRGALGQALAQLLTSVRSAAAPGSPVSITDKPTEDGLVTLCIEVGGPVDTEKDDWMAQGMGFWLAHQVFVGHGGALREPSFGDTVWEVQLPAAEDV